MVVKLTIAPPRPLLRRSGTAKRVDEHIAEISLDVPVAGLACLVHEGLHENPADYVDEDVDTSKRRLHGGIKSTKLSGIERIGYFRDDGSA